MNYSDKELKLAMIGADSVPDVVKNLGLNPYKGNTRQNIERILKRHGFDISYFSTVKRLHKDRYSKHKLIELVTKCKTLKEILLELDLVPVGTNYRTLKKYLNKYNIDFSKFETKKGRTYADYSEKNLRFIVSQSYSFSDVKRRLGLTKSGNGNHIIRRYINKYEIDISHFNPYKNRNGGKKHNLSEILVKNSLYTSTHNLKHRLYKEKLKNRVCEICGQGEKWRGLNMSLILDHIDGDRTNNEISNLRIVCPNCNATLPTHCGKNKIIRKAEDCDPDSQSQCDPMA